MEPNTSIIVLWMRKDLRISDHPILHHLTNLPTEHKFTHVLPVYPIPPNQVEVSGFIRDGTECPYPEARSAVGGYFRCGPHRAKFLAESVWSVKESLEAIQSGLLIRVGMASEVIEHLSEGLKTHGHQIGAVWAVGDEGVEENREEKAVKRFCVAHGIEFKLWTDEKYLIDDRDISEYASLEVPRELPDVFTTYRKLVEPLRERPRAVLPTPTSGSLLPFPDPGWIPSQKAPFQIPPSLEELIDALVRPVKDFMPNLPAFPDGAESAHPFRGGEVAAQERLTHLIQSDRMKNYKETRNGLKGTEFSTKLSAYLAQGCLTARQIHHRLVEYEDGTNDLFKEADGFGQGETPGTAAIRFELLWRDYMRLCHQKHKKKLFLLEGFKSGEDYPDEEKKPKWKFPNQELAAEGQDPSPDRVAEIIARFNAGTTGMGLIDASQRELLHTGYTSNRARQNVASFLAKHLGIDWRYGAEWYEMLLVDYDVSSNWANWAYVAGVGNDPRGELRIFNPVKQAFDYDKTGSYVRSWVPEVSKLQKLENVFQACTASEEDIQAAGLEGNIMVTDPVKRIEFSVDGKPARPNKRPFFRRKANQISSSQAAAAGGDSGVVPDESNTESGTARRPSSSAGGDQFSGGRRGGHASHNSHDGGDRGRGRSCGRCGYRGMDRGISNLGRGGGARGRGRGRGVISAFPPLPRMQQRPPTGPAGRIQHWEQRAQASPSQTDA